jgi:hypothetical protein
MLVIMYKKTRKQFIRNMFQTSQPNLFHKSVTIN